MIKSSRAFDANERVAEYRKSVAVVQENLLLFKGFLGPTIKDRPDLDSVGTRAARAAGVIVDALGKLRCPPGTPNANQFTDMQMSNCLIPSAETAAKEVASLAGKMIDGAKGILKSENVRNGAKASAMLALQTLDYMHTDGSGSLTDSTLMSMLLLRAGGAQVLEFATESLQKRGKISDRRKEQLDAIASKLKKDAAIDARNFVLANLKRRKEKKEKQKEIDDNLVAELSGTTDAVNTPKIEKSKVDTRSPTDDVAKANAAPPDASIRKDDLAKVTFDADSFNTELDAKITKLLDKYVPDAKNKEVEEYGDELIAKMGIPKSRSMKEMLDGGMNDLRGDLLTTRISRLRNKSDEDEVDDASKERLRNTADQLEKIKSMLETEGDRDAIRKEMGRGFVEALAGAELHMQDNPSLRGAFTFEIHQTGDGGPETASAYAWIADYPDGKIISATRFYADSLLISNVGAGGDAMEKGDMFNGSVKIAGTDDYQIGLSIHELSHVAHYAEVLKTLGINSTASDPPALEQIKKQGSKIGDTFIGAKFAVSYNIDPDTDWKDVEIAFNDKKMRAEIFGYTSTPNLNSLFAVYAKNIAHNDNDLDSDSVMDNLGFILNNFSEGLGAKKKLFREALLSVKNDKVSMYSFEDNDSISSVEKIRELVENQLGGQTIEKFLEEGKQLFDETLGFDSTRINTKGVKPSEIMTVLGSASKYAQTNNWEAFAEAKLLTMLTKNFPDTKIMDDKAFDEMGNMVNLIAPSDSGQATPTIMTPQAKAWIKRLQSVIDSMPELEQGSVI